MTSLIEVTAAWLRSFGYGARRDAPLEAETGTVHPIPLLVERDARRVGLYFWLHPDAPDAKMIAAARDALEQKAVDDVVLLTLAPLGDSARRELRAAGLQLWDAQRLVREFGEAVLYETCPGAWQRTDPLAFRSEPPTEPPASVPAAAEPESPFQLMDPVTEPPLPVQEPPLAASAQQAPTEFQAPVAFGVLDVAAVPAPPPFPPERAVIRSHVSKALALSLVRKKLGSAERIFLRLAPFHVFEYEANLLVEGTLDAQVKRGRMGVDAVLKRVVDWAYPEELGSVASEGAEVDEKKVRITPEEATKALRTELGKLVTRDVVLEEDADEWSVVVKKKVTLGPDDVRVQSLGTYWVPIWRVSGAKGAVEIDAATGNVMFEEIVTERTDAQLL